MLFWLFVILLVIGVIGGKVGWHTDWDLVGASSIAVAILAGIAILICVPIIIVEHAAVDATIAEWNEDKEAIVVKIDSGLYADELGVLDKLVIDEIRDYNKKVKSAQIYQNNFWVGIFYADIYDQFEPIEYSIVPHNKSA